MTTTPALNDDLVRRFTFRLGHDPEYDAPCVEKVPTDGVGPRVFVSYTDHARIASTLEAQSKEIEALRAALEDLVSWFPDKPSPPEWRITAGQYGADDAVAAARTALKGAS